jgi:hypothetical protein
VLDGAVLAPGVHPLKNQQQRVAIVSVEQLLPLTEPLNVFSEDFLIALLRLVARLDPRRPLFEFDLFSCSGPEMFRIDFHLHPLSNGRRAVRIRLFVGFIFPILPLLLLPVLNCLNVLAP